MKRLAMIALLTAVAGCGVDGEPNAPTTHVNAGVTVSNSGVYPSANIGMNSGPVSVNIGLGRWGWGFW